MKREDISPPFCAIYAGHRTDLYVQRQFLIMTPTSGSFIVWPLRGSHLQGLIPASSRSSFGSGKRRITCEPHRRNTH